MKEETPPFGPARPKPKTTPGHIDKGVMKDVRKFVAEHGGSIREVLEHGAIWVMSKGAKEYINKLKK
jgi:hypothetical protein